MAKNSRLKKEYRKNASKLHKAVGDMLNSSAIFSAYRIFQEYPVNRISPYFDKGREKFDWVIMDLMVVIECHGQQHYEPVRFGGITKEEAEAKFQDQLLRDLKKKQAAEKAGWTYVVFKYDEEDITVSSLLSKIDAAQHMAQSRGVPTKDRSMVAQQVKQKRQPERDPDQHRERLDRAKEHRKRWYQLWKRRKDADRRRKKSDVQ